MRLTIWLLLAALVTAGCSGTSDDQFRSNDPDSTADADETTSTTPTPPPESYQIGLGATGCDLASAIFLIEFDDAESYLPPGWMPRDARYLVNSTSDMNKAAVVFDAWRCAEAPTEAGTLRGAEVGIYVEAPPTEGVDAPAANHSFYQAVVYYDAPDLVSDVSRSGATVHVAEPTTDVQPGSPQGSGEVVRQGDAVYEFAYSKFSSRSLDGTIRHWQPVEHGLAFTDFRVEALTANTGFVAGCAIQAGTPLHEIVNATDCQQQTVFGLEVAQVDWTASFEFVRGATVTA